MIKQECPICCNNLFDTKNITCNTCDYKVCIKCQSTYSIPICIKCKTAYSRKYLMESYSKKYVESIYKEKKNIRFGLTTNPITKPTIEIMSSISDTNYFACPLSECRGFVKQELCGMCKSSVCNNCHELKKNNHTCDANILNTIKSLCKDTKECPKCKTLIFRISGCNHMCCTYCKTHFDWETNKILHTSSNNKYNNQLAIGQEFRTNNQSGDSINCNDNLLINVITAKKTFPEIIMRLLFIEPE